MHGGEEQRVHASVMIGKPKIKKSLVRHRRRWDNIKIGGLRNQESFSSRGKGLYSPPQRPERLWGPLSLLTISHRGWSEADRSPPSCAEAENKRIYTSTHLYTFSLSCVTYSARRWLIIFILKYGSARDWDQQQAFVNTAMNLRVQEIAGSFWLD
jgi:hypothetical protein